MKYFTRVEDGAVVTLSNGVYRQVDLYERGGRAYARHGGGFVRLQQHGATSHPKVRWHEIDGGDAKVTEGGGQVTLTF